MTTKNQRGQRKTPANSTDKKLAIQWLNEAFCLVSTAILAESFVLRIRHLRQATKR